MQTIIMYFYDHKPVRFTGDDLECRIQVANAQQHPSFVSWDILPNRVKA